VEESTLATLEVSRTSLGADGIPDKFVKEDLQQPYQLKISFEEGSKDIKISLESYKPN
jgi:hypothetical protein